MAYMAANIDWNDEIEMFTATIGSVDPTWYISISSGPARLDLNQLTVERLSDLIQCLQSIRQSMSMGSKSRQTCLPRNPKHSLYNCKAVEATEQTLPANPRCTYQDCTNDAANGSIWCMKHSL